MPYDGAGNYSLPAGSTAVTGTTILAATHNTPLTDIAAALSQVLLRSGVAPMTGNLDLGGFALVNTSTSSPLTITTALPSGVPLALISTNTDANPGPIAEFYRNSASPLDGDFGGSLFFYGEDSLGGKTLYAQIRSVFNDVTDTSEDGLLAFSFMTGGTVVNSVNMGSFGSASVIQLISTDPGVNSGPALELFRDSASPAVNDLLGGLHFYGRDSANNKRLYGYIEAQIITSVTSPTESGGLRFNALISNVPTNEMIVGNGILVGTPTGTYKGQGSLNAEKLWYNGSDIATAAFVDVWATTLPAYVGIVSIAGVPAGVTFIIKYTGTWQRMVTS